MPRFITNRGIPVFSRLKTTVFTVKAAAFMTRVEITDKK
jgi:hypothetical protein